MRPALGPRRPSVRPRRPRRATQQSPPLQVRIDSRGANGRRAVTSLAYRGDHWRGVMDVFGVHLQLIIGYEGLRSGFLVIHDGFIRKHVGERPTRGYQWPARRAGACHEHITCAGCGDLGDVALVLVTIKYHELRTPGQLRNQRGRQHLLGQLVEQPARMYQIGAMFPRLRQQEGQLQLIHLPHDRIQCLGQDPSFVPSKFRRARPSPGSTEDLTQSGPTAEWQLEHVERRSFAHQSPSSRSPANSVERASECSNVSGAACNRLGVRHGVHR
jgi:hypothetical protein